MMLILRRQLRSFIITPTTPSSSSFSFYKNHLPSFVAFFPLSSLLSLKFASRRIAMTIRLIFINSYNTFKGCVYKLRNMKQVSSVITFDLISK